MKKTMTLALAASILTLALAANPHTASAVGRMHKIVGGSNSATTASTAAAN